MQPFKNETDLRLYELEMWKEMTKEEWVPLFETEERFQEGQIDVLRTFPFSRKRLHTRVSFLPEGAGPFFGYCVEEVNCPRSMQEEGYEYIHTYSSIACVKESFRMLHGPAELFMFREATFIERSTAYKRIAVRISKELSPLVIKRVAFEQKNSLSESCCFYLSGTQNFFVCIQLLKKDAVSIHLLNYDTITQRYRPAGAPWIGTLDEIEKNEWLEEIRTVVLGQHLYTDFIRKDFSENYLAYVCAAVRRAFCKCTVDDVFMDEVAGDDRFVHAEWGAQIFDVTLQRRPKRKKISVFVKQSQEDWMFTLVSGEMKVCHIQRSSRDFLKKDVFYELAYEMLFELDQCTS